MSCEIKESGRRKDERLVTERYVRSSDIHRNPSPSEREESVKNGSIRDTRFFHLGIVFGLEWTRFALSNRWMPVNYSQSFPRALFAIFIDGRTGQDRRMRVFLIDDCGRAKGKNGRKERKGGSRQEIPLPSVRNVSHVPVFADYQARNIDIPSEPRESG